MVEEICVFIGYFPERKTPFLVSISQIQLEYGNHLVDRNRESWIQLAFRTASRPHPKNHCPSRTKSLTFVWLWQALRIDKDWQRWPRIQSKRRWEIEKKGRKKKDLPCLRVHGSKNVFPLLFKMTFCGFAWEKKIGKRKKKQPKKIFVCHKKKKEWREKPQTFRANLSKSRICIFEFLKILFFFFLFFVCVEIRKYSGKNHKGKSRIGTATSNSKAVLGFRFF